MRRKRLVIPIATLLIFTFLLPSAVWAVGEPVTPEVLAKVSEIVKEDRQAQIDRVWATLLAAGGGSSLLVAIAVDESGVMLMALLFGGGAWLFWNWSKEHEEKADKLRQELGGSSLLSFERGEKLAWRVGLPLLKINSEAREIELNIVRYAF